jgi:hypothetical protein
MKLDVHKNKKLKLSNVLIREVLPCELGDTSKIIQQQENYLKTCGAVWVGPTIQYTKPSLNEQNEIEITFKSLIQSSKYINNVEKPYIMESILRVCNCLYVRYIGAEEKMRFAYDKLNLFAFEEDIELKGDSYTILVSQKDGVVTADIFMEYIVDE